MTQKGFDEYRQQIWEQGVSLVDAHDKMKSANQLTMPALASLIVSLSTLMESFRSQYETVRANSAQEVLFGKISPAWIDPRFHDYYDFFTVKIIPAWEAELQGMQAAQSTIVAQAPVNTGSTSQFSSTNTTSQADAAGSVQPQAPYVAPQTGIAQTVDPYTTFEQTGFAGEPATQQASLTPLLIGGVVLGLLFMGKRKGGVK